MKNLILLFICLAFVSCSSIRVFSDFDTSVDFKEYKTLLDEYRNQSNANLQNLLFKKYQSNYDTKLLLHSNALATSGSIGESNLGTTTPDSSNIDKDDTTKNDFITEILNIIEGTMECSEKLEEIKLLLKKKGGKSPKKKPKKPF